MKNKKNIRILILLFLILLFIGSLIYLCRKPKKENFDILASPNSSLLLPLDHPSPKGWECNPSKDSPNIKECKIPDHEPFCQIFKKDGEVQPPSDWKCHEISNNKYKCCPPNHIKSTKSDHDTDLNCIVNGKKQKCGNAGRKEHRNPNKYGSYKELRLNNHSSFYIDILYSPDNSIKENKKLKEDEPKLLATIAPDTFTYVYLDPDNNPFYPNGTFYSTLHNTKDLLYKPYLLGDEDYEIHFGEANADFLRNTTSLKSYISEIPSLEIINHSYQQYKIYYQDKLLGIIGKYNEFRPKHEYSLLTDNNRQGFRLGSSIKIEMSHPLGEALSKENVQYIKLEGKNIDTITIGDTEGRRPQGIEKKFKKEEDKIGI
jgi:hypothetical protein